MAEPSRNGTSARWVVESTDQDTLMERWYRLRDAVQHEVRAFDCPPYLADPREPDPAELERLAHGVAVVVHRSPLLDALSALFERYWERAVPIAVGADGAVGTEPPRQSALDEARLIRLLATGLGDRAIQRALGVAAPDHLAAESAPARPASV